MRNLRSLFLTVINGFPTVLMDFQSMSVDFNRCRSISVTSLSFLSLFFLKKARKTTKKNKDFLSYRTPKIPGKERKIAEKNKEILAGKKARNSKKTRKGRTGFESFSITFNHCHQWLSHCSHGLSVNVSRFQSLSVDFSHFESFSITFNLRETEVQRRKGNDQSRPRKKSQSL